MSILIALLLCPALISSQLSPDVSQLMNDYWDWRLADMPEFASFVGVHDYDDQWDDMSLNAFLNRKTKCEGFLERALTLEGNLTLHDDVINIKEFKSEVMTYIDGYPFQEFLTPMCFSDGIHKDLENLLGYMVFQTFQDYNMLLDRYRNLPLRLIQVEDLMKEGVAKGIINHIISMKGVVDGLGRFVVDDPEDSPMWSPFEDMSSANLTQEQIDEFRSLASEVIIEVVPSFVALQSYVAEEYVTRPDIAVTTLPDGEARYAALIKFHTSTDLTPEEIHQIGLDEVDRISKEMAKIVVDLGYNMTVAEFSSMIRDDPDNYYDNPDDLLAGYTHLVLDVITPLMPEIVLKVPTAELTVEANPSPDGSACYYIQGSFDGSRPGIFYVNTYIYEEAPKYTMMSMSLHEGNPGHHLQGSYAIEDPAMPYYRRAAEDRHYSYAPSRFPIHTAYAEGWALHSENLGFDLELYDDPLVRYGHYSMEIYRATRLVVDTGMHALGWTREEAVNYMMENTAEGEGDIQNEVDRYITWPGQALGYKIGQLKMKELRDRATEELGQKFDLKEFHDIILQSVGPLDIMEDEVNDWIYGV